MILFLVFAIMLTSCQYTIYKYVRANEEYNFYALKSKNTVEFYFPNTSLIMFKDGDFRSDSISIFLTLYPEEFRIMKQYKNYFYTQNPKFISYGRSDLQIDTLFFIKDSVQAGKQSLFPNYFFIEDAASGMIRYLGRYEGLFDYEYYRDSIISFYNQNLSS